MANLLLYMERDENMKLRELLQNNKEINLLFSLNESYDFISFSRNKVFDDYGNYTFPTDIKVNSQNYASTETIKDLNFFENVRK